jgi:hypothetical protein
MSSPRREGGPARVVAQIGAEAVFDIEIIIERNRSVHPRVCTEKFRAWRLGISHHDGVNLRRIADFVVYVDATSCENRSGPVRLVAHRAGCWFAIDVPRSQIDTASWIADVLGPKAAASVTNYSTLRRAMVLFGLAVSE